MAEYGHIYFATLAAADGVVPVQVQHAMRNALALLPYPQHSLNVCSGRPRILLLPVVI